MSTDPGEQSLVGQGLVAFLVVALVIVWEGVVVKIVFFSDQIENRRWPICQFSKIWIMVN